MPVTEELLGVTVSPSRVAEARAIYSTTKWIVAGGLLYSLLRILTNLLHLTYSRPERFRNDLPYYILLRVGMWEPYLYCTLFIAQLIFYLRFATSIKKGLESSDSGIFEQSFTFLRRSNQAYMLGMVVAILMGALNLWYQLDAAHRAALRR